MKIEIKYHGEKSIITEANEEEIKDINSAFIKTDEYGNFISQAIILGGWPYSPVGIQYIRPASDEETEEME